MIEINLLPGKKEFRLPVVMGMDLNAINLKMVVVALIFHIVAIPMVSDTLNSDLENKKILMEEKNKKFSEAVSGGKVSKEIQDKVELLNQQEQKLQEKLDVVKQILKIKKNPLGIMMFITKNIPDDVWLTNMIIESDDLVLEGESRSYKSIGVFIEFLQGSIFFGNTVKLLDSKTSTDKKDERTELFKIGAKVKRYE